MRAADFKRLFRYVIIVLPSVSAMVGEVLGYVRVACEAAVPSRTLALWASLTLEAVPAMPRPVVRAVMDHGAVNAIETRSN